MSSAKRAALMCGECPDRGTPFFGPKELNDHYRNCHPGLGVFKCGQGDCTLVFHRKSSLIRHIESTHQPLPPTADFVIAGSSTSSNTDATKESDNDEPPHDFGIEGNEQDDNGQEENRNEQMTAETQEGLNEDPVDLSLIAAQVLLELRSTASLTGKAIERFQDGCLKLLNSYRSHFLHQLSTLLREKGMNENDISDLQSKLDEVGNPFKNLRTIDDQLEFFYREFGLVKPEPKFLDRRIDNRLDPASNTYVQTQVIETFQYISIIETLKSILSDKTNRENIFRDHSSKDGVLRSYMDGSHFQRFQFLQKHKHVLQIILYYDELEVAAALGSRTIIHKLGVFFFQIMNVPAKVSTKLSSIYLLSLVYADDMKKPGAFDKVILPFVQEMKKLSSDEGVEIKVDGLPFTLRAVLVTMAADTLAAHDVLGFLGPSATHFCRACMISRKEFKENENSIGELRSPATHDLQVEEVERVRKKSSLYGVRRKCPLNKVPFYHCVGGSVFDAFHDVLEGICPLVIKCVLRHVICVRKLISVKEFNSRVGSFDYGFPDSKNRPSPNFTTDMLNSSGSKLKQKGAQTWCLMRALPFLIGDLLPVGDKHMELVFLLQDAMKIMFSFEVRPSNIDHLENLISRHNSLFKSLYIDTVEEVQPDQHGNDGEVPEEENPDEPTEEGYETEEEENDSVVEESDDGDNDEDQNDTERTNKMKRKKPFKPSLINKMHHWSHYGQFLREMGPLVRMWCAKFEARLKIFRQHSAIVNCFKNIPMTMAKMFQLGNCARFNADNSSSIEHSSGEIIVVTENDFPELYLEFRESHELIFTKSVTIDGEEYRPGLFVASSSPDSINFFLISEIFVEKDTEVYMRVKPWKVNKMCPRYNAHHVSPDDNSDYVILKSSSLTYCHAIAPWVVDDGSIYLSVRTLVL